MSSQDTPSGLTDAQYDQIIRETLARIESTVDRWLDEDVADIDAARTGGMLTLALPNRSQLIINAQPPLHELWLAAKRGGFHFSTRRKAPGLTPSQAKSFALLSACASEQLGKPLKF